MNGIKLFKELVNTLVETEIDWADPRYDLQMALDAFVHLHEHNPGQRAVASFRSHEKVTELL
ncbi:hypothetical protein BGZ74_006691, partial [Mortierella antarctica]